MDKLLKLLPAAAILTAILLGGCTSVPEPKEQEVLAMSEQEREKDAKKVADIYMDSFVKAFRDDNYEIFRGIISPEMQKTLTPEKFREMRDLSLQEQGMIQKAEFALSLDKAIYHTFVWKLTYEKEGSDGEKFLRDFLFYVRVGKTDETTFSIAGAGFCL